MSNRTITIPKPHLILAICLPLAVLLGYFLAEPMESSTLAIVTFILVILAVPLMMKWHYPLLIFFWNAGIAPVFFPGRPFLWMLLAPIALLFALLNRAVAAERPVVSIPSINRPLLFFLIVVVVTAFLTGGFGFRSLGGSVYGGRNYFHIVVAACGYFAISNQRIPINKSMLYVTMFYLPAITFLIPHLLYFIGPSTFFLFSIFPSDNIMEQIGGDTTLGVGISRLNGLNYAVPGFCCFLLARFGIRGLCNFSKPWRFCFFLLTVFASAYSGFRSTLILVLLTSISQFMFEGLYRTRFLPAVVGVGLVGIAALLPITDRLPMLIQRSISFLPVKVSPIAERSAKISTQWRVDIWKQIIPEIPQYLIKGKGYAMDPQKMFLADESIRRGEDPAFAVELSGDYHNGPLSVIMPFGIFGVIGFVWFLVATLRYLYRNWRFGDPRLKTINTFLLAAFVARLIFFCFVFGALYSEFYVFTGLAGLSVCLNGEELQPVEAPMLEEEAALEAFS